MRVTIIVIAILSAMVLTACNGASGGAKPTATFGPAVQTRLAEASRPRATRTPTPEGMAQVPTVPAATATPQPATPAPQPTMVPAQDPADEVLLMALLTEENMPAGWYGGESFTLGGSEGNVSGDDGMLVSPGARDYCGSLFDDPYLNQVAAPFAQDESGQLMMQFIALYASDQAADLVLSQTFAAMQQCPEYEEVIDGEVVATRINALDYPDLGDRSGAFTMAITSEGYQSDMVVVGYRVGRTVSMILHIGEIAVNGPAETWETQQITQQALEKINALRELLDALERPAPNVV